MADINGTSQRTVFIYDLTDPRTGCVRYVGKSVSPKARLATHIREARGGVTTHCKRWIDGLLKAGFLPAMGVIEETTEAHANDAERYWIGVLRLIGADLTNRTPGGDGQPPGYRPSAEAIERARKTSTGRKKTPEQYARMLEAFNQPDVKARRSQLMKERYADPAKAVLITGPNRGTKLSGETKAKMSRAWTPERKAAHAAEKSAIPVDDRWREQLNAARANRWAQYREAKCSQKG
jgi:hypothetical protein